MRTTETAEATYTGVSLELKAAAAVVANAMGDAELRLAVDQFMQVQVDWYNAIPRDGTNTPIAA